MLDGKDIKTGPSQQIVVDELVRCYLDNEYELLGEMTVSPDELNFPLRVGDELYILVETDFFWHELNEMWRFLGFEVAEWLKVKRLAISSYEEPDERLKLVDIDARRDNWDEAKPEIYNEADGDAIAVGSYIYAMARCRRVLAKKEVQNE